jgi:hypothetical protein
MQPVLETPKKEHDWKPGHSKGYSLGCSRCGITTSIQSPIWNTVIHSECKPEVQL